MIPMFKVAMSKHIDVELLKVLKSGWIGQGEKVEEYERILAKKFNNKNVLSLSSGTHGLTLALHMAGVGPGTSVICPSLSCSATVTPVVTSGADIIWADTGDDINMIPQSIEDSIREDTKAIIVVHWGGFPVDLETISKIAKDNNLILIEDAAHTFGSTYKDSIIGDCNYSDFCMISTQAIKSLTTVDGGILFTKNIDTYKRGKLLRWFGINRESNLKDMRCVDDIVEAGYKFHLSDVGAVIGLGNIQLAEENVKIAQSNSRYYDEELKNVDGIITPQISSEKISSSWLYTILVEDRTSFANYMGQCGIATSRVHERLDNYTYTKKFQKNLPNLDSIYDKYICIPVGFWVTKEDREYIIDCIKKGW